MRERGKGLLKRVWTSTHFSAASTSECRTTWTRRVGLACPLSSSYVWAMVSAKLVSTSFLPVRLPAKLCGNERETSCCSNSWNSSLLDSCRPRRTPCRQQWQIANAKARNAPIAKTTWGQRGLRRRVCYGDRLIMRGMGPFFELSHSISC